MSAATSAAPMKRLTSERAPGRRTTERAAGHQRRLLGAQVPGEQRGRHGRREEVPPALRREHLHPGVGRREREDHAAEGSGQEDRPGRSASRAPPPTSRGGRPAVGARSSTGRRKAARPRTRRDRAGSPTGRAPTRHEQLPQVTSLTSAAGSTTTRPAAATAITARRDQADPVEVGLPGGGRDRRRPALSAARRPRGSQPARTRPTTRLTAKITRQSETARITAPYSGPITLPSSCTADTIPRGTPRRSTG